MIERAFHDADSGIHLCPAERDTGLLEEGTDPRADTGGDLPVRHEYRRHGGLYAVYRDRHRGLERDGLPRSVGFRRRRPEWVCLDPRSVHVAHEGKARPQGHVLQALLLVLRRVEQVRPHRAR